MTRWAGAGAQLWRVRVDLFAGPPQPRHRPAFDWQRRVGWTARNADVPNQMKAVHARLKEQLTQSDGDDASDAIGLDQGTGAAGRNVMGMLFWVRADDVGQAAATAVEVARRAGERDGVGPELYDVTVIPRDAVSMPGDPGYPAMPD